MGDETLALEVGVEASAFYENNEKMLMRKKLEQASAAAADGIGGVAGGVGVPATNKRGSFRRSLEQSYRFKRAAIIFEGRLLRRLLCP